MAVERSAIRKGMAVYGADGETVGRVIQPPPEVSTSVDPITVGMTDADRRAAAERLRVGAFEVEDPGFLGIGAGGLHIPLSAVMRIDATDSIILDCTRDQARERYGPPPSLKFQTSGPPPP